MIARAGFAGAGLLVAGPLYPGATEPREEDIDLEGIEASTPSVSRPEPPSPWWWLLPPVMYLIRRRRGAAFRRAAIAQLTAAQREQFTRFINKVTRWFVVALGASVLAAEQTWQVAGWLLIGVMPGASVLNTAVPMSRST